MSNKERSQSLKYNYKIKPNNTKEKKFKPQIQSTKYEASKVSNFTHYKKKLNRKMILNCSTKAITHVSATRLSQITPRTRNSNPKIQRMKQR